MAEAIEFSIVKALADRIRNTVRTANGYHFNIETVKLNPRHKVEERIAEADPLQRPYAIVKLLEEPDFDFAEKGSIGLTMPIDLIVVADIDETEDEELLRSYYRLRADIETVLAKQTFGGLINLLTITSFELAEPESSTIRVTAHLELSTLRTWGQPNG